MPFGTVVAITGASAGIGRAIAERLARDGAAVIVICNAGFGVEGSADDVSTEHMRRLMDVNDLGTFCAARAALPQFRRQGRGHLIFVSSIVGKRGVPYMGAYSATKFAQGGAGRMSSIRARRLEHPCQRGVPDFDRHRIHRSHAERVWFGVACARSPADRRTGRRRVARTIERPAPEVYPYRRARGLVVLNALAPGLCDRFVKRFGRQRMTPPS